MTIQTAKARLQTLVRAGSVAIRNAPTQPITNPDALPLSIVYLSTGTGTADNATTLRNLDTINVDVHFPRDFLQQTHDKIDTFVVDFRQRLAGDPTLNNTVDTIVFPVTYNVVDDVFGEVDTKKVGFEIPVKVRETPVST